MQSTIPKESKRHFPGCLVHNNKLHLLTVTGDRVYFSQVHVAGQMGTSLSSATLSWLPCKPGLQHKCSGSLKSRRDNVRTSTSPHRACLVEKMWPQGVSTVQGEFVLNHKWSQTSSYPQGNSLSIPYPRDLNRKDALGNLFLLYREFCPTGTGSKTKEHGLMHTSIKPLCSSARTSPILQALRPKFSILGQ